MDKHRRVSGFNSQEHPFLQPFSSFDFIEKHYGGEDSIRRIFSLARSHGADKLVVENISPIGILKEVQEDLQSLYPDYTSKGIHRLSFWKIDKLIGYAIVKHDMAQKSRKAPIDRWHVFESIMPKYEHAHNCVRHTKPVIIRVGNTDYNLEGYLYCQQNSLSYACAHVALRTILSSRKSIVDVSYRDIRKIACDQSKGKGLDPDQIGKVLNHFGVKYQAIDYGEASKTDKAIRNAHPYNQLVYSGVESGGGALIGFKLGSRKRFHIIPAFGHTFNKDTWIVDAEQRYFQIKTDLEYIPSERWTSSLLAHDDNVGPNYCIPRLYIENKSVSYVAEIFREGIQYSGTEAEVIAINWLDSIFEYFDNNEIWQFRILSQTRRKSIILRAVALSKQEYIQHLQSMKDWKGNIEDFNFVKTIEKYVPEYLWMVEISTTQLFPANERKLGEIILDGSVSFQDKNPLATYCFARIPSRFIVPVSIVKGGRKQIQIFKSLLISHTELWKG
jgi:hypothetical protein